MKRNTLKVIWKYLDIILLFIIGLLVSTQFTITGNFLSQLLLVVMVAAAEKFFVGRANVIQNVGVIVFLVYDSWDKLPNLLQLYLGAGIVLGIIGAILYFGRNSIELSTSLKKGFNGLIYAMYSMKSLLGLYFAISLIGINFNFWFWILAVIISFDAWLLSVRRLGHDTPWEWTE